VEDSELLLLDRQRLNSAGNQSESLEDFAPEAPEEAIGDDGWIALDGAFAEFGLGGL
jgi:hypothetical protein